MRQSKFIDLLAQLTERERSRFRDLSWSPFFNKNQKLRQLIGFCLEKAPDFIESELDKTVAFRLIYGAEQPYNELQINNLLSDALQLLQQMLTYQELEQEPALLRTYETRALLNRRAEKQLPHSLRRLRQLTERMSTRSHEYFHQQVEQNQLQDRYALLQSTRRQSPHLQRASDALDLYYCCHKMRLACDMASRNRAINAQYECHYINEVLSWYQEAGEEWKAYPALQTYYQALMMLTSEEEGYYKGLRESLAAHGAIFSAEEQQDLYDYAQNYCVKRINSGDANYYQDILELYKLMLDQGVLLRQGYLTQWSYINIVTAGIRLKEYDWTDWFIHAYREHLAPEVQENVFTYNLAALQFGKSDYLGALQILQGVEFSDAFYHMSAKIIQIKSYKELGEDEALLSLLEASRKYIKRNRQLSAYQKQSNSHFLRMIGKIHKLQASRERVSRKAFEEAAKQLRRELESLSPLTNKSWLREKLQA
ncbi:MAG: hypothetical protein GVY26_07595 [Bacteroidetes bacterium]|jgi:hypothetical protein|nr:hypothetical protein [Bacteroidota bacterium]